MNWIYNHSILIAVLIAFFRRRHISRDYLPFVIICTMALVNEFTGMIIIKVFKNTSPVITNVYILLEALLWTWQFERWGTFRTRPWVYPSLVTLLTSWWIVEQLIFGKVTTYEAAYWIVFSFGLVFLSIHQINQMVFSQRGNLLRNARFLICCGILIFYTYLILVQSFYLQLDRNSVFLGNVFGIVVYVNLFVNLVFALATLWIPKKQSFSLPS